MMKRMTALVLTLFLVIGLLPVVRAAETDESNQNRTVSATELPGQTRLSAGADREDPSLSAYADTDMVTVIVELNAPSLMDGYSASTFSAEESAGAALSDYLTSASAQAASEALVEQQNEVLAQLDDGVATYSADNTQVPVQVLSQWTSLVNGMAIRIPYGRLAEIQSLPEVKNAYVAHTYEAPAPAIGGENSTYGYSYDLVNLSTAWGKGYTGKGMLVAVLDTGLDLNYEEGKGVTRVHEAFTENSFRSDVSDTDLRYTSNSLKAILNRVQLNATTGSDGGKITYSDNGLYKNRKVPFAFDYAGSDGNGRDLNVQAGQDHGVHVAGTIAGYAETAEGEVRFSGVAPDAQLMIMKVFPDGNGGANDANIFNALEDAMKLGADVVNLSLGSDNGFAHDDSILNTLYAKMEQAGILVVTAAGNSDTAATNNHYGGHILASNPETSMVASPSVYDSNLSVASFNNVVKSEAVLNWKAEGGTDTSVAFTDPFTTSMKKGFSSEDWEVIAVPGYGTYNDFSAAGFSWYGGKTGIALVKRGGGLSFDYKVQMAQYSFPGVKAVIVYDEDPEATTLINMGMEYATLPCAFISGKDGAALAAACAAGKVTLRVQKEDRISAYESARQMSSFSSWGAGPALELKPDITAPGGNIYSTVVDPLYAGGDYSGSYDMMSGTSMASPHVAGLSALVEQYVRKGLAYTDTLEAAAITNALLSSTALPQKDPDGMYYSPRSQGAGLVNVGAALSTPAYISVAGQKTGKLELGDDPEYTGHFDLNFRVNNLTADTLTYNVKAIVLSAATEEADGNTYISNSEQLLGEMDLGAVTVPAGGVDVSKSIRLTDDQITSLKAQFPNGAYVEGFVVLTDTNGENPQIGLPFLGFLGDWTAAPIFDSVLWTDTPDDGTDIRNNKSTWGVSLMESAYVLENTPLDVQVLGSNIFDNEGKDQVKFIADNIAISPNGDHILDSVNAGVLYQLRNAKLLVGEARNKATGELYFRSYAANSFKTYYSSNYSATLICSTFLDRFLDEWAGTDLEGNPLPSGTECVYTIYAYTDGDYPSHVDETTGETVYDYDQVIPGENEPTFNGHAMDMTGDIVSFPVTVDTNAPKLVDGAVHLRQDEDGNTYMSGTFTDDGALASVEVYPLVKIVDSWYGTVSYDVDTTHPLYVHNIYDASVKQFSFETEALKYTGSYEWTGIAYVYGGDYGANDQGYAVMVANSDEGIQLSQNSALMYTGDVLHLSVNNNTAEEGTLVRSSSDPAVATIDADGNIEAKAPGQTIITVSNGTASAVCVIAVEEKPTQLTDFTLALEQFDGLKPAGQLEIRVTDIQPGDVVLDDENITYRLELDNPEQEDLFTVERSDDHSAFYLSLRSTGTPKDAGSGTLYVTIGGITRSVKFSWEELYEVSDQDDIIPRGSDDQILYVNPGETIDLVARYKNSSTHKIVPIVLWTGDTTKDEAATGLVLDGPAYCTAGGAWTGKLVNTEGYALPESIHIYERSSYGYDSEWRNSEYSTRYTYDASTGEISFSNGPFSTYSTLLIRADGVASEGNPAGALSGIEYPAPDGQYGPFQWTLDSGSGTLKAEEGFEINYEKVNGAHFTATEPGVNCITAASKDGKYALHYAVVCLPVRAESLKLDALDVKMAVGDTLTPAVTLDPEPTLDTDKVLRWTSFAPETVSVDENGVLTAHKTGYALVKVELANDSSVYNYLTVSVTGKSTVTYTDGVNGEAFAEQRYEVETGGFTPAFVGIPERTGYTFTGWDKAVSALVLEDTTYTATWQANTYTVTLEANGGELDSNTLTVTFGAPMGELPVPTLAGHTFLGWFDANGEAVTAETLYRFAGDSVFTAKWSENTPPTEPSVPTDPTEPKPTEPKPTEPKPTEKPTEPVPTEKPTEATKPGTSTPATGDTLNVPVLVAVLVVAAIGIGLLLFFLLRKKKDKK